jgi:electron transfer flavoprotein beta subunit
LSHVVIVTKGTPPSETKVQVDANGKVDWGNAQLYLNPWDEYTVTEALILKDAHSVKTTALVVGPEGHLPALKDAISRGVENAIRLWDESMENLDSLGYATVVAAAIKKLGDVSLVVFGKEMTDIGTDAHIYQVGRKLGWSVLGSVYQILEADFKGNTIKVERLIEEGKQTLRSKLPAVIGLVQTINKPREPTFKGIKLAGKATIPVWTSADLGIGAGQAQTRIEAFRNIPPRQGKVSLIEGATIDEQAEKLVEKLIEEKVV